jgi:hypothetical protein
MSKFNKATTAVAVFTIVALGKVSAAMAQATDPTGGATTDVTNDVTGWVEEYGIVMLVAFLTLGTIVTVMVKYVGKARNKI